MKEINILILSGGSSKGIAYIGVFKKLQELQELNKLQIESNESDLIPKINIKQITSVSAGSIFALVYTIGYTYKEMLEEVLTKNFDNLRNIKIMNFISK